MTVKCYRPEGNQCTHVVHDTALKSLVHQASSIAYFYNRFRALASSFVYLLDFSMFRAAELIFEQAKQVFTKQRLQSKYS